MESEINFSLSRKKQRIEIPKQIKNEIKKKSIEEMEIIDNITKSSNTNKHSNTLNNSDQNITEEENEEISSEPYSKCTGCYPKFQPNQLAHCEDKNGCLYVETDDSLTYSP